MDERNLILIGKNKDKDLEFIPSFQELKKVRIMTIEEANNNKELFVNTVPQTGQSYIYIPEIKRCFLNTENIEFDIERAKISILFSFCRKLGAKKCDYGLSFAQNKSETTNNNTKVGAGYKGVEGKIEVDYNNTNGQKLKNELRMSYTYEGGRYSFDEAKSYFEQYPFLNSNLECQELLDSRNPTKVCNQIKKYEITMTISHDISSETKVAAGLETKTLIKTEINIDNRYTKARNYTETVLAHYTIEF